MRSPLRFLLTAVLAGLLGGVLCGQAVAAFWDPALGLWPRHWTWVTLLYLVLVALAAFWLSRRWCRPVGRRALRRFRTRRTVVPSLLAAAVLLASGVLGLLTDAPDRGVFDLVFALSSVLLFLLLLYLIAVLGKSAGRRRQRLGYRYGALLLFPVLWAGVWVFDWFRESLNQPLRFDVLIELFALLAVMLCLCAYAGFYFYGRYRRRTLTYAFCGIAFSLMRVCAPALALLLTGRWYTDDVPWAQLLRFVFAVIQLMSIVYALYGHSLGALSTGRKAGADSSEDVSKRRMKKQPE